MLLPQALFYTVLPLCNRCGLFAVQPHTLILIMRDLWLAHGLHLNWTKHWKLGTMYIITEKYIAWHFIHTTQYHPITKKGGLWAGYTNPWLKEKQQQMDIPPGARKSKVNKKTLTNIMTMEVYFSI